MASMLLCAKLSRSTLKRLKIVPAGPHRGGEWGVRGEGCQDGRASSTRKRTLDVVGLACRAHLLLRHRQRGFRDPPESGFLVVAIDMFGRSRCGAM